jgi:hypothetical protein
MKYLLPLFLLVAFAGTVNAQKVESIHFHLYTDSLKKGTHNYINVDGKLNNGRWMPLTAKDIRFTSDYGHFEGNDLVLPEKTTVAFVTVKAELISDPSLRLEQKIWIKTIPNPEVLPTKEDVLPRRR